MTDNDKPDVVKGVNERSTPDVTYPSLESLKLGPMLKIIRMNNQIKELQTIIRDKWVFPWFPVRWVLSRIFTF